ncbi:MAG: CHAD domain-containing protein [Solirubrobacterales bacterium]
MSKNQGDRSRAYRLKSKETPANGIRRIAIGRADKALEGLSRVGDQERERAVHEVRKNLKKLRSSLRMVKDELGDDQYRKQNKLFRDAGRELSGSRDAAVKVETLNQLVKDARRGLPARPVTQWRSVLATEAEPGSVDGDDHVETATGMIVEGRKGVEGWSLDVDGSALVEKGLTRSYSRGRKAMKDAKKDPTPANFHEWRKRTKDLWYQLRIVRKSWPSLLGETADLVHELADLLGDHHDLAMLAEDLDGRDFQKAERRELEKEIERQQSGLADGAFSLGERIYAEKPKHFQRRLAAYWEAWR